MNQTLMTGLGRRTWRLAFGIAIVLFRGDRLGFFGGEENSVIDRNPLRQCAHDQCGDGHFSGTECAKESRKN
jgi:hypothetical protein